MLPTRSAWGAVSATGFDHFALVRTGYTYYLFKNGILANYIGDPRSPYYNSSLVLGIGGPNAASWTGGYYALGYLDELRVSNGKCTVDL